MNMVCLFSGTRQVERLRSQHACHLEELRVRLSGERAAAVRQDDRAVHDKYRCLKEKYARLKHDVKVRNWFTVIAATLAPSFVK